MSLDVNSEKCAVCKAYLFEDDDIAYCPECGAPHHRECYNSIGHCGLQEFHGTENQYKKAEPIKDEKKEEFDNTIECGMCGQRYDFNEMACPHCNAPNLSRQGGRFVAFDFLGGVPGNTDLGDGITANEAKKFVLTNTHRYIPKFLKFKNGGKASWNWLAFFFPGAWLLSRKMYIFGSIVTAIQIALTFLTIPFSNAVYALNLEQATTYFEIVDIIRANLSTIGKPAIILLLVSYFINVLLSVLLAIFADYIYKKRVISSVSEIKRSSLDVDMEFRKKGGVSLFWGLIGIFAVNQLPSIIVSLLRLFI